MLLAERGETETGTLSVELVREVGREAEAMYPDDSEILLAVGRMYLAGGEIQKALRPLTRAGKITASSRAFRLLGEVLLRLGDAQVAVAMFKRAIQDGEDDPDTEGWYASAKAYVPIQEAHGDAVVAQSVAAGLAQVTAAEEPEAAEQPEEPAMRARMPSVHRDRPLPRFPSVVDLSAAAAIAASMSASAGGEDQPLPRFPSSTDLKSALFQHALSDVDRSALEEELTGPTAQQSISPAVRLAARAALSEPPADSPAASPAEPPRVHPAAATPAAPIATRIIDDERSDLPLDEPTGDSQIATGVYPRTSPAPIPTVVVNAEPRPTASASSAAKAMASAPSAANATAGAPRAAMKTVPLAAAKGVDLGLRGTVRMNATKDGPVLAENADEPAAGKGSPALAGNTIPMTVGQAGDVAPISAEGPPGTAPAGKAARGAADSRATRPEAPPTKSSPAPASAPGASSAPPAAPAASSAPPAASSVPPAAVLPVSLVDHSAWDREIAPRPNSIPVVASEPRRRRGQLAMRLVGGVLLLGILGVAGSVLAGKPPWLAGWLRGRTSQSPDSAGVLPASDAPPNPTAAAPEPPVTAAAVDPPAPEPENPALDDAGVVPVATTEPVASDAGTAPLPTAEPVKKDAGAATSQTIAPPRAAPPKRKEPDKAPTPTKVPPPPTKAPKTSKPTKVPATKQKDVVWLGDPERSQ